MAWNSKRAILSQEVIRRFLNTSEKLNTDRRDNILLELTKRLQRSDYKVGQIREILVSGLRGYNSKWGKDSNRERHRRARDTEDSRRLSKLIGKTTWFKDKAWNLEPADTKGREKLNNTNMVRSSLSARSSNSNTRNNPLSHNNNQERIQV